MNEARRLQALGKEKRLQVQAKNDRDEFQRIIEAQKEARDMEMKAERERQTKVKFHFSPKKINIFLDQTTCIGT